MTQSLRQLPPSTPVVHCLQAVHTNGRPQPPADAGQKQKKKRLQRNFQETTRWEHDEHREDDIEDFIRSELKIVNDSNGLSVTESCPELRSDETIAMVFFKRQHMGCQERLHKQHDPQMSAVAALQT